MPIETHELVHQLKSTRHYDTCVDLLTVSLEHSPANGLRLEFGYASGHTARHISQCSQGKTLYSFDSFEGLPENWNGDNPKGAYACKPPQVPPDGVSLVVGLFQDTLPSFLAEHRDYVAFVHIDCDLYSSTKTVLTQLAPRFVEGTVLNFNEFWDYPGESEHEAKAFAEFLNETEWLAEPIGWAGKGYIQGAFRLFKER